MPTHPSCYPKKYTKSDDVLGTDRQGRSGGLCPSHTGAPGGRKAGYQMLDYVINGEAFGLAFRELALTDFSISWRDAPTAVKGETNQNGSDRDGHIEPKTPKRLKFTCPVCTRDAWAKPSARLSCTNCSVPMVPQIPPTSYQSSPTEDRPNPILKDTISWSHPSSNPNRLL